MDIVCIASVVVLATPFDRRHYTNTIPAEERAQRKHTCEMYQAWREWFGITFIGTRGGAPIDWECDIFSVRRPYLPYRRQYKPGEQRALVHLAVVLALYHKREAVAEGPDVLLSCENEKITKHVQKVLNEYRRGLGLEFVQELARPEEGRKNHRFFLFEHLEIQIRRRVGNSIVK